MPISTHLNRLLMLLMLTPVLLMATGCASDEESSASASAAKPDPQLQRLQTIAEGVTIMRDDFGVAHIYADTDADAAFGFLYAQAEDDFPRIERNYLWAIGRLAEVEGESALYSDLRAKLYMTQDEAQAAYEASPDWLQALCDAFADGLNYYLATHPQVQPQLLTRFEPWMPFYFFEGSIGGDIEAIGLPDIEAFYSQAGQRVSDVPAVAAAGASGTALRIAQLEHAPAPLSQTIFAEPAGSNGFAVTGTKSESGNAILMINPHTSFYFRGEYHVVSAEGLNAYGASTWGQFFIYQGFNETTGWMHTSTGADFMDEFVQDVVNDNGRLMYRYGDELRPLEVMETTLRYRDGDSLRERRFPLYRTHQGPITHSMDGQWVATRINWNPVDALRQSYLRMKTADYDDFLDVMNIRTNSSNNTVFADAKGNIAYFHGNFMPRRDPQFDYSQPVDGSNPATDWQGVHEVEETVMRVNPPNDWLQNTNATPFTVAGAHSPAPEDYPVYMAPDAENFRGLQAVSLLEATPPLNIDSMIALAYDTYLQGFAQLIPGLITAWEANADSWPELEQPIDALRNWDLRVSAGSVPMSLAHFYGMNAAQRISTPTGMSRMEQVNWLGTDSAENERLSVFSDTLAELEEAFGSWATPWGEINRYQRLTGAIDHPYNDEAPSLPVGMASSRWGALASYGARAYPGTDRIYGTSGNSFVAVVAFGERVRAKSLLAGGQSADPESPHFDDQALRYINRVFKDVAYYREDVEKRALRTYHPGE